MPANDKRHLGSKALRAALDRLKESHATEFAQLLGDEREKLGLPRERVEQKKASRLEKLREQLRAAGIEPEI